MASRRNYHLTSKEVVEALCNDDDSDVEAYQEDDIKVVVLQGAGDDDDHLMLEASQDEEFDVDVPRPERGRPRVQVRGAVQSQRLQCVRTARPLSSRTTRDSQQEIDEATTWTYTSREKPLENPIFEQVNRVLVPNIDENASELDCFLIFFPESIWKLLKTETNRYASQMKTKQARQGILKQGSMLYNWKPVTLSELKKFMCIIIHMTLVHKETFDSYWSTKEIIYTSFASKIMKRARFRAIYSCLHLNDNSKYIARGQPNYDAFFKLRPYFDELCQLFQNSYYPGEELTIDEGTFGFRGRDKPDKYGMKIYMLCDAETGYILRMTPYVGDSKTVTQIVTELTEPYFDKWHTVYMDRYFTSPVVADLFWLRDTRIVGTVMQNRRGLPQHWRQQPLEVNEMAFCHRGNLTACKWKDKRDICFLTTKHAASWTEVTAKSKGGPRKKIKPDCILDYNLHKIGVDLNNQYVSYYSLDRKSMKWWKKMFFHLVARATVNAYILHKKTRAAQTKKLKFSQFLHNCGEGLLGDVGSAGADGPSHGPHGTGQSTRLIGRHFARRIPPTAKKARVARVCKVCADKTKKQTGKRGRKETTTYCPECDIPLCMFPCFEKYHTLKDYTV